MMFNAAFPLMMAESCCGAKTGLTGLRSSMDGILAGSQRSDFSD
jgi:hypothetical protein